MYLLIDRPPFSRGELEVALAAAEEGRRGAEERLMQAAAVGKALLVARASLQEENEELKRQVFSSASSGGWREGNERMTQSTAEDLHARIRALQAQLLEAERANQQLLADYQLKSKKLDRLSIGPRDSARLRRTLDGKSEEDQLSQAQQETLMKLEQDLEEANRRLQDTEGKMREQQRLLQDKITVMEAQLASNSGDLANRLKREKEDRKALQKRLEVLEQDLAVTKDNNARAILARNASFLESIQNKELVSLELKGVMEQRAVNKTVAGFVEGLPRETLWFLFALLKAEECSSVQNELHEWQQLVKKLGQDKEIAEEKFQETLMNSTAEKFHTEQSMSLEAETERLRELEAARRALMQIRNRTVESEALRKQISVMVQENERLSSALQKAEELREDAERKAMECEIEMEIWRERGVQMND